MAGAMGSQVGRHAGRQEMRRHRDCPQKHWGLEGVQRQREKDESGMVGEQID